MGASLTSLCDVCKAEKAQPPAASPPACCSFSSLPDDLHLMLGLHYLGLPEPIAQLAAASRALRSVLSDHKGQLIAGAIDASRLATAAGSLHRVRFQCLQALRVDLLAESAKLLRRDVEGLITTIGGCLQKGMALSCLAIRLATYDASMERLSLGKGAWQALVQGLSVLGRHGKLRSLELSFVAIKLSQATQAVAPPCEEGGQPLSLLLALQGLECLEELSLTHADLFGGTVLALAEALQRLPRLQRVDLSRNRISRKVLRQFKEAMPPGVKVCGEDLQTLCCDEWL